MSYQSTVLADNPVAFFMLNEASGNFADSSTNGSTGTPNGTITRSVSTGFAGAPKGITIGAGGYISVPSIAALDVTGAVSFELLMAHSAAPAAFMYLASKGGNGTTNGGYGFWINTDNTFHVNITTLFNYWPFSGGYTITADGVVRHYIFTSPGDGSTGTLYENGVAKLTTAGVNNAATASTKEWEIGAGFDGSAGAHNANGFTIAAVSLYAAVLSPDRVSAHFAAVQTAASGGKSSSPGQLVAALAHSRNIERKEQRGQPQARHRSRLDYLRRRRSS